MRLFLWAGLAVLILQFPMYVGTDAPDGSFQQVLGYLWKSGQRAGYDYIFTYGPLGYFHNPCYDPDLFVTVWYVQVISAGLLACCFVAQLGQLDRLEASLLMAGLLAIASGPRDPVFLLLIVLLGCSYRPGGGLTSAVLALLGLMKFTYFLTAIVVTTTQTWAARSPRPLLAFVGCYLLAWWACGQHIGDLGLFVISSLELAGGYSNAMAIGEVGWDGLLAVGVCGCLCLGLGRSLATPQGLIILWALFQSFKHGYVRHDGHESTFYAVGLVLPLMAYNLRRHRGWLGAAVGLSWLGFVLCPPSPPFPASLSSLLAHAYRNCQTLVAPEVTFEQLEAVRKQAVQNCDLPQIRALIGQESVDVFTHGQGVALLNGVNLRSRPVFQSYCAYTGRAAAANARFVAAGPDWALLKLESIDGHFPLSEDGPAMGELLARYQPMMLERGWLALRRRSQRRWQSESAVLDRVVRPCEQVNLSDWADRPLWVEVHLTPNWVGKLLCVAYRAEPVFLGIWPETGPMRGVRLIPGISSQGFLLNPLVDTIEDFAAVAHGEMPSSKRVQRLSVFGPAGRFPGYDKSIRVVVRPWRLE